MVFLLCLDFSENRQFLVANRELMFHRELMVAVHGQFFRSGS